MNESGFVKTIKNLCQKRLSRKAVKASPRGVERIASETIAVEFFLQYNTERAKRFDDDFPAKRLADKQIGAFFSCLTPLIWTVVRRYHDNFCIRPVLFDFCDEVKPAPVGQVVVQE